MNKKWQIYENDENKIEETRTSELLEKVKLESNKYFPNSSNNTIKFILLI